MANATTKLTDIINPEVMGDMIEAKLPHMLKFTPFAKIDNTLVGVPGDTKTVPSWDFIGAAVDVAEGNEVETKKLTASTATFTIKKAMQSISITQESINSGLGDPVAQGESQLAKSIAVKLDADVLTALNGATLTYKPSTPAVISYDGIVDAIGVLDEEENTEKVMFIAPAQATTLRKDANFIDKNKYGNAVMVTGEIGMVGNTRIVPTKQIVKTADSTPLYKCPIVKLEPASTDSEYSETELPAVTVFLKADTKVDHEWFPKKQTHDITAAKYYGVALTNKAKVVLASFKA